MVNERPFLEALHTTGDTSTGLNKMQRLHGLNYYSFDMIVGGSCLSSPARMHFGALNTAIQQLGSIAYTMQIIDNS